MNSPPRKNSKKISKPPNNTRHPTFKAFVHLDSEVASGAKSYRKPRDLSAVSLDHLAINDSQRSALAAIYNEGNQYIRKFDPDKEDDQLIAASILATNRMDTDARECLENKWSIRWSQRSGSGKTETWRVLYQW